ncbi:DivIVA domain-containing protein [Clostridium sp. D2Q-11]|uniref:DivIVA domain-containing protein n=1 Tax=Anaeromonas frigoriresistens TaxID=2683708 RepID=A0A942UV90_9FIRM|nr:DivIVA domain-containing protein [Anaeromonas frigoriresistens]MBS4539718.1 DivIVA domain-containing protein [Anaeromonas frigoriresistens]
MLTPLDIQNKEFGKGVRGYNIKEVETFLDEIIADYEKLYKENIELKDKMALLNDQLKHYTSIEETLQNTLVVAQKTAEEVNMNAKAKYDNMIKEAEMKAKDIIDSANKEVISINQEYEDSKKEMLLFKMKFKTLLRSQLEMSEELFIEELAEEN